ncbi:ABC transporter substrate-binding protein [Streptomyces hoynatensis]|nr:extracellular solute-binding protein [Streptomyces hoynatensis]
MLVLSLLALAACGGGDDASESGSACAPSGEKVTIDFWSWVPGIEHAVELWNEQHPDIQVNLSKVPDGRAGTYQNYNNAIRAGRGTPDLGMIEYDRLPDYRLQNALENIGPCGAAAARDQFVDYTWPLVTFGEQDAVYAVPEDTGPMVLYYRADLFEQYGIEVPRTWEQFAQAADEVAARGNGAHLTNLAPVDFGGWFAALAWQNGARWFDWDDEGWTVTIDDEPTRQVADLWQQMIDNGDLSEVPTFTEEWNRALAEDQLLSWVGAAWGGKLIELGAPSTEGKWAVAPLPQWQEGAQASANWGGSTYAVFEGSDHPYEATQFALWLNTHPESVAILNEEGGAYPAAADGTRLPALTGPQPFFGDRDIYQVINEAAGNIDHDWVWGPTMSTTFSTLEDEMAGVLDGAQSFRDALDATQRETVEDLQAQSLTVTER